MRTRKFLVETTADKQEIIRMKEFRRDWDGIIMRASLLLCSIGITGIAVWGLSMAPI